MKILKLLLVFLALSITMFAQTQTAIQLTWNWTQGTGGAATQFSAQRGTVSGGPYTQIGVIPFVTGQTAFTYDDLNCPAVTAACPVVNVLTAGTTYYYVVLAQDPGAICPSAPNSLCQAYSNQAFAVFAPAPTPPPSPSGLGATVVTCTVTTTSTGTTVSCSGTTQSQRPSTTQSQRPSSLPKR